MKIETKRLLLRPFTAADGEDLYSYLSDPEVVRFEPYDVFTKADAEKEAARRAGDPNFFRRGAEGNRACHRQFVFCAERV